MKSFKLLPIVMVLGLAILSCSKDEDNLPMVSGNKYESSYAKVGVTNDTTNATLSYEYKTKEELAEKGYYKEIEFKSYGAFYENAIEPGTWKQINTVVEVTSNNGGSHLASVSSNKVVISFTVIIIGFSTFAEVEYTKM